MNKNPIDVVKYLLFKCAFYGDVITNLKMQKVLYFVYVWTLINLKERCFEESFEAWPNGPVLPSVYHELKEFGASPIDPNFSELSDENDLDKLKESLGESFIKIIDDVYEECGSKTAFELVNLTHSDAAWLKAREGLSPSAHSNNELSDEIILENYGE